MKQTLLILCLLFSAIFVQAQSIKKDVAKDIAERKADYAKTAEMAKSKPDTVYEVKEAYLMKMLDLMTAGSQGVSTSKYFSEVQRES